MLNEEAIVILTNRLWVSRSMALSLLTPSQLNDNIERGRIRCQKRNEKKNGRWDFNLLDLLKCCDIAVKPRSDFGQKHRGRRGKAISA